MKWLWAAIAVALGIVMAMLLRRNPVAEIKTELDAAEASRKAKELAAKEGAEKAREAVEREHHETLQALDEAAKTKAEQLRSDPHRLAAFLVRASKRS